MTDKNFKKIISEFTAEGRLEFAKKCVKSIVDHVTELVGIEQTVNILFHPSPFQPGQLGRAGVAASKLRWPLIRSKIIGTQSVWDETRCLDTIAFPMLADVLDCIEVINLIEKNTFSGYDLPPPTTVVVGGAGVINELDQSSYAQLKGIQQQFAHEQAKRARNGVCDAIRRIRHETTQPRMSALRNHRVRSAHLVRETRAEKKGNVPSVTFDEEAEVFQTTLELTESLYNCVCGVSFDITQDVRDIERKDAEALWLEYLRPLPSN